MAGRCSDGFDRQRQDWISKHCDEEHTNHSSECPVETTPPALSTTGMHLVQTWLECSDLTLSYLIATEFPTPAIHSTTVQSPIISTGWVNLRLFWVRLI